MLRSKAKDIQDWQQYYELMELLDTAKAALINSSAKSGSHMILMHYLSSKFNLRTNGREAAMRQADQLLQAFERQQTGTCATDEHYAALAERN